MGQDDEAGSALVRVRDPAEHAEAQTRSNSSDDLGRFCTASWTSAAAAASRRPTPSPARIPTEDAASSWSPSPSGRRQPRSGSAGPGSPRAAGRRLSSCRVQLARAVPRSAEFPQARRHDHERLPHGAAIEGGAVLGLVGEAFARRTASCGVAALTEKVRMSALSWRPPTTGRGTQRRRAGHGRPSPPPQRSRACERASPAYRGAVADPGPRTRSGSARNGVAGAEQHVGGGAGTGGLAEHDHRRDQRNGDQNRGDEKTAAPEDRGEVAETGGSFMRAAVGHAPPPFGGTSSAADRRDAS